MIEKLNKKKVEYFLVNFTGKDSSLSEFLQKNDSFIFFEGKQFGDPSTID
jgi:hypothetical protein